MKARSVIIRVTFSVSLVLAIIFFLGTIGLGTYAIINAGLVASCVDNDPGTLCKGALSRTDPEYNYWLAGAAGAAVLESLFAAFMFCAMVEMTKEKQLSRPIHIPREFKELENSVRRRATSERDLLSAEPPEGEHEAGGGATLERGATRPGGVAIEGGTSADDVDGPIKVNTDVIGGEEVKEWQETTVRSFTPLAGVVLFFGILAAMCALLCTLWGIAVAYNEFNPRYLPQRPDGSISVVPYIIVNYLIGIGTPILLFFSTGLIAIVLDFITIGRMDMRRMICYILPAVSLQEGKENYYWAVLNAYYFPLNKRPDRRKHGFLYSCDKNRYTWYFAIICALSMLLVFSYFVDLTVTDQRNYAECPSDPSFVCFLEKTFAYVNCTQNTYLNTTLLHCYKFLRFGVDVNLITALSQSFAFYLLIITLTHQILFIVKFLLTVHPSRFWGCGLFAFCGLLIAGAIAAIVKSDVFIAYTNILSILEFFMVAIIVFMIGLLVVEGQWWEKVPIYAPRQLHFVQYGTTTRRELKEIEHVAALEESGGKEILHKEMSAV